MRTLLPLALAVALVTPARAQDDPKALITKAVEAHGGAATLDKYLAGRVQTKGVIVHRGAELPFTSQIVYQTPDRIRSAVEVTADGVRRGVTQILNNGRVSLFVGAMAQQVPTAQADEMKVAIYVRDLTRLTPLLK